MDNNEHKYYSIKTTEEMKDDILAAIPLLEQFLRDAEGNQYIEDVRDRTKELLENARMCQSFDIWEKDYYRIREWAHIEIVDELADGNGNTLEFNPPRSLLRIGFPTGQYIFGYQSNRDYYEQFIDEICEQIKPDFPCWAFGTLFYKPEHARKALEVVDRTLKKYRDGAAEANRQHCIQEKKRQRDRLQQEIDELEGQSHGV